MTDRADPSTVSDAAGFAAYTRALLAEIHENAASSGPFQAESFDIQAFLEAMTAWSETPMAAREIDGANPWQAAARLLKAGHYYE